GWGRLASLVAALVVLSACSIDVSGVTPAATSAPQSSAAAATAPLVAPTRTLGPTPTLPLVTRVPNATAENGTPGTPAPAGTAAGTGHPKPTPFSEPVTWADQHLTGKLIFTAGTEGVLQFDLATGNVTNLFAPPDPINSWVVAAAISANPPQQVIAYAPPPVGGDIQFGYT